MKRAEAAYYAAYEQSYEHEQGLNVFMGANLRAEAKASAAFFEVIASARTPSERAVASRWLAYRRAEAETKATYEQARAAKIAINREAYGKARAACEEASIIAGKAYGRFIAFDRLEKYLKDADGDFTNLPNKVGLDDDEAQAWELFEQALDAVRDDAAMSIPFPQLAAYVTGNETWAAFKRARDRARRARHATRSQAEIICKRSRSEASAVAKSASAWYRAAVERHNEVIRKGL